MDRLRAEGLIDHQVVGNDATGTPVTLRVMLEEDSPTEFSGNVVFVNPEIDPVDGKVRIWAEIDNEGMQLRPGLRGDMFVSFP